MSAKLESFTAGVETSVDVAGIERQLTELWHLAGETGTDAITRACMFNFVAIADTETARDHATEVISELTSRHPCRAIVLLAQPDAQPDELSSSITAHCHLAGGGRKQVCCEQISIRAAGNGVTQLAGAVLPLLESDLPTVVWWNCDFLAYRDLFERLNGVADRIFFDTSTWPDSEAKLAAVAEVLRENPRRQFCDLSWTRLGLWQAMTADLFDPPECREELPTVNSVELVYGRGEGARLRSRLYAGWLAARLGRKLKVSLRETDDPQAGCLQVTIRSAGGTFEIRKNHGEQTASSAVHLPTVCELPRKRAFWPTDDASLLSQELDSAPRRSTYAQALAEAQSN